MNANNTLAAHGCRFPVAVLVIIAAAAFTIVPAHAATIEVDATAAGPSACTLADAVATANTDSQVAGCERVGGGSDDTITFASGFTGPIVVTTRLTIAA